MRPVSLKIPAINVDAPVTRLGLNRDQSVEVPTVAKNVGWYAGGTQPGQRGSAVLLGHLDSKTGPAVFYRLRFLKQGDRLHVRLADGAVEHFKVTRVATYLNDDFPAEKVYLGNPRRVSLNLVTCGGAYDSQAGGYQSNVVVYTALV